MSDVVFAAFFLFVSLLLFVLPHAALLVMGFIQRGLKCRVTRQASKPKPSDW